MFLKILPFILLTLNIYSNYSQKFVGFFDQYKERGFKEIEARLELIAKFLPDNPVIFEAGGHYGTDGYPHLHLSALKSPKGEYQLRGSRIIAADAYLIDPLTVYYEAGSKFTESVGAPSSKKSIAVPYVTMDNHFRPKGTRVVWPVACDPK